jgi:hypothetical protein
LNRLSEFDQVAEGVADKSELAVDRIKIENLGDDGHAPGAKVLNGLVNVIDCQREIEAGELTVILDKFSLQRGSFHIYYPSRRQMPGKLRVFIDYIRDKLGNA